MYDRDSLEGVGGLKFSRLEVGIGVGILLIALGIGVVAMRDVRAAAGRMTCENNVKQIVLAVLNSESAYDKFPAAAEERPARGWMWRIVPYLEATDIYRRDDPQVDWYAPRNAEVYRFRWRVYLCDRDEGRKDTETVGPVTYTNAAVTDYANTPGLSADLIASGLLGPVVQSHGVISDVALTVKDVTDGTANTLLVVESVGRPALVQQGHEVPGGRVVAAPWMDHRRLYRTRGTSADGTASPGPRAVNGANATFEGGEWRPSEASGPHRGGVNVGIADGSVRFLADTIGIRAYAALVTAANGDGADDPP